MFKIGEFSKLSMLTVKALRFYEKEGLLLPVEVDRWSGYRFYDASQLETAATIKALRQLDFSVEEIRAHLAGEPLCDALKRKQEALSRKQADISTQLSIIKYLMEDKEMKYQAVIKEIGETIVYSEERVLNEYSEVTQLVLSSAEECLRLNPGLECVKPDYGFCEYLDGEHKDSDIRVRYSQAVTRMGVGNQRHPIPGPSRHKSHLHLPQGALRHAGRCLCVHHKLCRRKWLPDQRVSPGVLH